MKIDSLVISNFRGIAYAETGLVGEVVIVAGQNGSGKSCVFDAIKLLKSMYGEYQQNEWHNFFGEFAIQPQVISTGMAMLFNDAKEPIRIEAQFSLRAAEKLFVSSNARTLLAQTAWQRFVPEAYQWGGHQNSFVAQQFLYRQPEVERFVEENLQTLLLEASQQSVLGVVEALPSGSFIVRPSILLSVIFSNYLPRDLGIVDFHGAQRNYNRENVQSLNLNLDQAKRNYSQHTLYNYQNKYNNIKSELAANYIKDLLVEKAGVAFKTESEPLTEVLQELFNTFFPDKKFLGPKPASDGTLSFPVETQNGRQHDLNELSSGEKEILYGYLRIRSSTPRNSIILLDEPELHLNPRLIRGLPEFYRKHLGAALDNQLWLVTHSDALIRETLGKPAFSLFHMTPCGTAISGRSQLRALRVENDLHAAITDLVGDLASYSPDGKCIIFEGGGDTDLDRTLTGQLFADTLRGINLISATNKARVQQLQEVLERAHSEGQLATKFYAISDMDGDQELPQPPPVRRFNWDVYHIENYLLDNEVIAAELNALQMTKRHTSGTVEGQLLQASRDVMDPVIEHQLRNFVNNKILTAINLGIPPHTRSISISLLESVKRSTDRMARVLESDLIEENLIGIERSLRAKLEESLNDGSWRSKLPGREILKRFTSVAKISVSYEIFRNLLVSRMVETGKKPEGMNRVLQRIRDD